MESDEQILLEVKITGDINEFFYLNNLAELVTEDVISEAIEIATQHNKNFRDVHTELRLSLNE